MAGYTPYKDSFEKAKLVSKYANVVLWISTGMLVASFIIKTFYINLVCVSDIISNINCLFLIFYGVLNILREIFFYQASIQRRNDFIDNSFDTSLGESRSVDYYTNGNIATGIYKMGVNSFENSFFTYNIGKRMILGIWLKNVIFVILILVFAIFGFKNAFILFIQLTLPISLFQQSIKHTLFVFRISRVFENYRKMFNDLKNKEDSKSKRAEIISNVLDYETTLTYWAIILDSKLYEKLNTELSAKWIELKNEYNIKELTK